MAPMMAKYIVLIFGLHINGHPNPNLDICFPIKYPKPAPIIIPIIIFVIINSNIFKYGFLDDKKN
jgi:hypothetical protein